MNVNVLFEIVNGAWAIGLTFFIIFLIHYLFENRIDRDMTFWQWVSGAHQSPSVIAAQVAVALLISDTGNWIVRGSVWIWRETTGGAGTIPPAFIWPIMIGGSIGAIGILCKLRVFSRQRFGNWPWLTCGCTLVLFVAYKLLDAAF